MTTDMEKRGEDGWNTGCKEGGLAYVVGEEDNVATAITALSPGKVRLLGQISGWINAIQPVPEGYKIALTDIPEGTLIWKYGVKIARAARTIRKGESVHIHNVVSLYDERSSHFDAEYARPQDMRYDLED